MTLSPGGEEYVRITQEMKKLRAAYDKKSRMPKQLASRRIGLLFDMNNYWEMEFQRQTDQWWTMPHIHKYYNLLKSLCRSRRCDLGEGGFFGLSFPDCAGLSVA